MAVHYLQEDVHWLYLQQDIHWLFTTYRRTFIGCSLLTEGRSLLAVLTGGHSLAVHYLQKDVHWLFTTYRRTFIGCSLLTGGHSLAVHYLQQDVHWLFTTYSRTFIGCTYWRTFIIGSTYRRTLSVIGVGSPVHSSSVSVPRRRSKSSTVDRLIGRSCRHRT